MENQRFHDRTIDLVTYHQGRHNRLTPGLNGLESLSPPTAPAVNMPVSKTIVIPFSTPSPVTVGTELCGQADGLTGRASPCPGQWPARGPFGLA